MAKIPVALRWEVWERDDFQCVRCRARRYLSIDHIIPVSVGGKTEKSNLQTLCCSCNSSKNVSLPLNSNRYNLKPIRMEFTEPHCQITEAAGELERPRSTIYRWVDAGRIVSIKLGGILFIPKTEVERIKKAMAESP